jgi:sulfoxide reductase heme-binding subunit YedZ
MQKVVRLGQYWLGGIRLYIGVAAVLLTLEVWWWAQTLFGGTQLEAIRIQEIFAWLSIIFLALTLLVGPVTKLSPKIPGIAVIRDSRRALGIAAAWFATLHVSISYFKQFEAANPLTLPLSYQHAMLLGVIALLILLAMAATSVNILMKKMGVWWFRLHRLVYPAVILTLIHAFMIGAHAVTTTVLIILSCIILFWIGLNIVLLVRAPEVKAGRVLSVSLCIMVLAATLTYGLSQHYEQVKSAAVLQGHDH